MTVTFVRVFSAIIASILGLYLMSAGGRIMSSKDDFGIMLVLITAAIFVSSAVTFIVSLFMKGK
jgi:hypothetical protein